MVEPTKAGDGEAAEGKYLPTALSVRVPLTSVYTIGEAKATAAAAETGKEGEEYSAAGSKKNKTVIGSDEAPEYSEASRTGKMYGLGALIAGLIGFIATL